VWSTVSVRRDVRARLDELASKLGMSSPNDVISYLLSRYANSSTASSYEELLRQIAEVLETHGRKLDGMLALMDKLEQVLRRLSQVIDSLEQFVESQRQQAGSTTVQAPTEGQKPAETPTTAEAQPAETGEREPKTFTWCRSRSEIRSLEGFVEWVKQNYGLIDYWEEEGKVCFETEREPKQVKGRKRRRGGDGG
jgi:TolA-binding protein